MTALPVLDNAKPQIELVPWISGDFIINPTGFFNTFQTVDQQLILAPVVIPGSVAIVSMSVDVATGGTAGSVIRVGLYDAAPVTFKPNHLVFDAGTVASTGTGVQVNTLSPTLIIPAGLYYQAFVSQGAPVTKPIVRASLDANPYIRPTVLPGSASQNTFVAYALAGVAGALPANFTLGAFAGGSPYIMYGVGSGPDS